MTGMREKGIGERREKTKSGRLENGERNKRIGDREEEERGDNYKIREKQKVK